MRTLTIAALTTLHADRSAHGPGRAPSIAECLDAARAWRLYDVDTQSAGYDGLSIGDDADDVIAEWAEACGVESPRGWTAERVGLAEGPETHRSTKTMTTANYDYTDALHCGEIVARHDMIARWSGARYQIVQLRSPKRTHDVWLHLCISNGETLVAEFTQRSLAEAEDYVHRCDRSVVAYGETVEGGAYVLSPGAGSALTRAEYESACAAIEATQWPDDGRVSVMTPPSAYITSNTDADDAGRVLAARRRAGIEAEAAR